MKLYLRLSLLFTCLLLAGSSSAANYYWIGGSGNWNDALHWSSTSGGAAFYSSPPTSVDDVHIDNNSGLSATDSIQPFAIMYCHSFTIDSLPFTLRFTYSFSYLDIYGDLSISSPVDLSHIRIDLEPTSLTSNIYAPYTSINGISLDKANCTINILSTLHLHGALELFWPNTTFNSNSHDLYLNDFSMYSNSQLNLGFSKIYFVDCIAFWTNYNPQPLQNTELYIINSSVTFSRSLRAKEVYIDDFSDATFNDTVYLDELTCLGYLYLQDGLNPTPDTISKLVMHNGTFFLNLVTDTIIYNIPPNVSLAFVFDELTVNDYFEVNGSPGSEIFMAVNSPIAYASLYMNMPLACLDFLSILDVNVYGPGLYYAGANSSGGGLNWIWSGCALTYNTVWPGDVNYDLVVDHHDFLYVGLGFQSTGTPRDSISNYFAANNSLEWFSSFPNGINFNHADCNGDSIINADDTLAITQNYGLNHPAFAPNNSPLPQALLGTNLTLALPGLLTPGMNYTIPIIIGDSILNNLELHGLAFSLIYDTNYIDPASVDIQFGASWFALPGASINFKKNYLLSGKIDFAMTRFDGVDAVGGGRIAWLTFTVKNNVSGGAFFQFMRKLAVNSQMEEIFIVANNIPIWTTVGLEESLSLSDEGILSPNPASEFIVLTLSELTSISRIEIFSVNGTTVLSKDLKTGTNRVEIDIRSLKPGMYFLRAQRINLPYIEKRFIIQ